MSSPYSNHPIPAVLSVHDVVECNNRLTIITDHVAHLKRYPSSGAIEKIRIEVQELQQLLTRLDKQAQTVSGVSGWLKKALITLDTLAQTLDQVAHEAVSEIKTQLNDADKKALYSELQRPAPSA